MIEYMTPQAYLLLGVVVGVILASLMVFAIAAAALKYSKRSEQITDITLITTAQLQHRIFKARDRAYKANVVAKLVIDNHIDLAQGALDSGNLFEAYRELKNADLLMLSTDELEEKR